MKTIEIVFCMFLFALLFHGEVTMQFVGTNDQTAPPKMDTGYIDIPLNYFRDSFEYSLDSIDSLDYFESIDTTAPKETTYQL